ncbi:kinase-like protein, partial [Cylindrobasidium torrendii FP15055 ss-10]
DLIRHIAWETLQGLHYMHTEGVMVHRDIALDNILMDARLRIKIIDLGAVLNKRDLYPARCVEHTRRHLMASEALYTEAWSPAADIWSLGLALMQLV